MLEVKNVRCGYDNNEIIKGVSFNVEPGSNLCIVGPNGCGKSTLLKSIANLLNYKGSILLNGKEISKFNRKDLAKNIALMSQASSIYFPYTVYETVSLGRYAHLKGVFSRMSKSDEEKEVKVSNGISLSSGLVAGGSIIGLVGIILQVTGVIKPRTPVGFVASNMMGIILLIILVIATTIPIMMSKVKKNEE